MFVPLPVRPHRSDEELGGRQVVLTMRGLLALTARKANPVEVHPNSHWAPVPAKILSHLGYFTERSCFVTQGETEGEEANTEMSLVPVDLFFIYCIFPLFSLAWLVGCTLCVPSASLPCMYVSVDPPLPCSHQPSLLLDRIYY